MTRRQNPPSPPPCNLPSLTERLLHASHSPSAPATLVKAAHDKFISSVSLASFDTLDSWWWLSTQGALLCRSSNLCQTKYSNQTCDIHTGSVEAKVTMTAIDAVPWQGAGGNLTTIDQRRRGGRCVRMKWEKRKVMSAGLRVGTLNVGTMAGKGRELVHMMQRRKVDIQCVQETR